MWLVPEVNPLTWARRKALNSRPKSWTSARNNQLFIAARNCEFTISLVLRLSWPARDYLGFVTGNAPTGPVCSPRDRCGSTGTSPSLRTFRDSQCNSRHITNVSRARRRISDICTLECLQHELRSEGTFVEQGTGVQDWASVDRTTYQDISQICDRKSP